MFSLIMAKRLLLARRCVECGKAFRPMRPSQTLCFADHSADTRLAAANDVSEDFEALDIAELCSTDSDD